MWRFASAPTVEEVAKYQQSYWRSLSIKYYLARRDCVIEEQEDIAIENLRVIDELITHNMHTYALRNVSINV